MIKNRLRTYTTHVAFIAGKRRKIETIKALFYISNILIFFEKKTYPSEDAPKKE
jgi:hypothetical protein